MSLATFKLAHDTPIFTMDNQQGPTVQHRELCSMLHGSLGGRGVLGENRYKSACNVGDPSSTPGSGRSLEEGNGNPLQYSCLENLLD